ncbi:hypothetical protein B484DRAFT_416504 [Ochromonadaceae sp. CCMP2298]|nr:hypothetical protein B484DRAFT_416504 [Ochromonadaceae sp. CCMP2298]
MSRHCNSRLVTGGTKTVSFMSTTCNNNASPEAPSDMAQSRERHHPCGKALPCAAPLRSGAQRDCFEEIDWELPPQAMDFFLEDQYYHYPGVTLSVHQSVKRVFTYERAHGDAASSKSPERIDRWEVRLPQHLRTNEHFKILLGSEEMVVTCVDQDELGTPILVSLLVHSPYVELDSVFPADHPTAMADPWLNGGGKAVARMVNVGEEAVRSPGKKRVHFAPLATARYLA